MDALIDYRKNSKLIFFSSLGYFFSIQVRGLYGERLICEEKKIRAINEFSHRVFQQLRGIAKDDDSRTPEDIIMKVLWDIAREGGLEQELVWALSETDRAMG